MLASGLKLMALGILLLVSNLPSALAARCAPLANIMCPAGTALRTEGCPDGRGYCGHPKTAKDCTPLNTLRCEVGMFANPEGCSRGSGRCTPLHQAGIPDPASDSDGLLKNVPSSDTPKDSNSFKDTRSETKHTVN